ncbi:uncharacterized protein LOC125829043 [Solanum verrucosum]|uniref:uncharacterized protein LOC125829043 n=1 Tax=Solanum verrucosum TaxID=315347 RepID=UPI0020D077F8|nr:uncharacterized protein LOC125829043 [Solanum verrucosum]
MGSSLVHEDPQVHIQNFLEISDTYTPTGVNSDYVRLTLIPVSLLGEAKRWLNFEPMNSITSWDNLARKFLIRFFLSGKIAKLRSDILSFRQKGGENLYQAEYMFKSILLSYLHHHQSHEVLVHTFIEGPEPNTKILLDSAVGGQDLEKTYAELFTQLNKISHKLTPSGMDENMMNTHFSNLSLGQQPAQVNAVQQPPIWCEICGGEDHNAEVCGANPDSVNFVGNAQRGRDHQNYGNFYNPSWRNHPNFSWGGNQNQAQGQNQYRPRGMHMGINNEPNGRNLVIIKLT